MGDLNVNNSTEDSLVDALDTDAMDGFGVGVLETAEDPESGRSLLVDLYKENKWKDEKAALAKLEEYGNAVKQKFKDPSRYGEEDLLMYGPIPITDIPLKEDDSADDIYDRWTKANLDFLQTTTEPEYIVAKKQLEHDIPALASDMKRKAYTEDLGTGVGAKAYDLMANVGVGIASSFSGLALGSYDDRLTESTSTNYEGDFSTGLAQGLGSTLGFIAGSAVNPLLGMGAIITQGGKEVVKRAQETERVTGDTGDVVKATALEAGSQALQIVGERLVFGKAAPLVKGEVDASKNIGKTVLKDIAAESGTEGTGQIISNAAENVQQGDEVGKDVTRGAGKAALIGGIVAGGVNTTVEVNAARKSRIIAQQNSGERLKEAEVYGAPFTPQVKQTIGPINPLESIDSSEKDSFDISGYSDLTEEQKLEIPEADNSYYTEDEIEFIPGLQRIDDINPTVAPYTPKEVDFTTEDGSIYHTTEEGLIVKENPDGTVEKPFDFVSYLTPETANKIGQAIIEGGQVVTDEDGSLTLEEALPDGSVVTSPIETTEKSPGVFPLEHSVTRKPNKQTVLRPISTFGAPIKDINLNQAAPKNPSVAGASYGGRYGSGKTRLTTFGERLQESKKLPGDVRELGSSLFYDTFPSKQVGEEFASFVDEQGGLRALIDNYVKGEYNAAEDAPIKNRALGAITNALIAGRLEAEASGNTQLAEELKNQFEILAPDFAIQSALGGQTFQALSGITSIEPLNRVNKAGEDAYIESVSEEALAEGVSPSEIMEADNTIKNIDNLIVDTKNKIEAEKVSSILEVSAEALTLDEAIGDIEVEAQTKLDEDLSSIEKETIDINEAIVKEEEKATKQHQKEVVALEKQNVADTLELTKAIEDAVSTKEEVEGVKSNIEGEVQENYKAVETETNKLVKEAVVAEKKNLEETKKTRREELKLNLDKANQRHKQVKQATLDKLKKLHAKLRQAEKDGDITEVNKIKEKIQKQEELDIKSLEKVRKAEQNIISYEEELQASKEDEKKLLDTLDELESGVEIQVKPQGKKRKISIKTKKSGLDITSLFKKDTPQAPLSALAKGINALVNTTKVGESIKNSNDAKIKALNDRLKKNKELTEKIKKAGPLTDSQKKAIAAAKKRLADLEKAKSTLKLENYIPKGKKKNYEKYKTQRASIKATETNPRLSQAEEKLKALEKARKDAEKLKRKNDKAKEKAEKAKAKQAEKEKNLLSLKNIKKRYNLQGATGADIEDKIAQNEAVVTKDADKWFRVIMTNLIGNPLNSIVAIGGGIATVPFQVSGTLYGSTKALLKKAYKNKNYKLPILGYLHGLIDIEGYKNGFINAKNVLRYGKKPKTILSKQEINPYTASLSKRKYNVEGETLAEEKVRTDDFINYLLNLKKPTKLKADASLKELFTKAGEYLGYGLQWGAFPGGVLLRSLQAVEAITLGITGRAVEEMTYNAAYNKALDANVSEEELNNYIHNYKAKWTEAQAEASKVKEDLAKAGYNLNPAEERLLANDLYQKKIDQNLLRDIYKISSEYVLNSPATGVSGVLAELVSIADDALSIRGVKPIRYFVPVANSIANFMEIITRPTPLGFIQAFSGERLNKTALEREMAFSTALVGTTALGVLAARALAQLDLPEEEREWDIIGNYSKDKKKRDSFNQQGGKTYSIRIGKNYIPFQETFLAGFLGSIAALTDKKRDGDKVDFSAWGIINMALLAPLSAAGKASMFRGVNMLFDGIGRASQNIDSGLADIAKLFTSGTIKGIIPAAGIQRTIARYTDSPLEAKKDFLSILVEGIPFAQSYGKPALNIFGEPIKAQDPMFGIHRLFSTKNDDLDIRFLVDNGYTVPDTRNLQETKKTGVYELEDKDKYEILKMAGPQLRQTVSIYRRKYGSSGRSDRVQELINKRAHKIIDRARYAYVKSNPKD